MGRNLALTDHMLCARHCAGCLRYSETIVCVIFLAFVNRGEHWLMLGVIRGSHFSI